MAVKHYNTKAKQASDLFYRPDRHERISMIHPIREIILLIFLVLLCSLFSAAERAFSKTNEKDIEKWSGK